MEQNLDELAAIEALNSGKTFSGTKNMDVKLSISTIRYYAGWADKIGHRDAGKQLFVHAS